uniref:Uncharacterized protein n=1 Tax=Arundo donax TaxID=35708 RepID=A0A0A9GS98_ARUDO
MTIVPEAINTEISRETVYFSQESKLYACKIR